MLEAAILGTIGTLGVAWVALAIWLLARVVNRKESVVMAITVLFLAGVFCLAIALFLLNPWK